MVVDPDFVFIVSYECPRCRTALEARASGPPTWLRCPECGRASLPPEHMRGPRPPVEPQDIKIGTFTTGSSAALPIRPRSMAPMPLNPAARAPAGRLMLGSAFFLTICLFLFSLLSGNAGRSALFGIASAVFLFLLSRPVAPNRE
ncbi:hypothetical protein P12x_005029 [Tundrisphaera lichenicola]|uniref:hypothetical protein n=1 Tax=Tundrisphaera lichenicola TaxID=2029860 RepID=UPI003EC098D2